MPDSWRDHILREFTPHAHRLTLVADPDGLVMEEGVVQGIQDRGFALLPFEDPVAFRFAYESRYRSRWDRGEAVDLVVVVAGTLNDLGALPYDLLQVGRTLSFRLSDLFPTLSYHVVAALDRAALDALYQAQAQAKPGQLGDNATRDYVLRHVFEIDPHTIDAASDLLRVLLRRHYKRQRVPAMLDERLIQVLHESGRFQEWPLESIVPDRDAFLSFLQERWPIFLDRLALAGGHVARDARAAYVLEHPGPPVIPFDDQDVRAYVDSLFLDGLLRPVSHKHAAALSQQWVVVGLHTDPQADRMRQMDGLMRSVESSLPSASAKYQDWLLFAYLWARLAVLRYKGATTEQPEVAQRLLALGTAVDTACATWVQQRYGGLYNLPPQPPAMLHHIPRVLAARLGGPGHEKIALVVLDGLALDQWIVLREVLDGQRPRLHYDEGAAFAWLPTITSVSRQSIFAGAAPLYYPQSIFTTDKEAALWTQFWGAHGLSQAEVAYLKGLGEGASFSKAEEVVSHPKVRVTGLVVDTVDKIMHGMKLGTAGMHNQVRQWAEQGFMARLVDLLLGRGFAVYVTSDHGNVEATGWGKLSEGVLSELSGVRARVYSDEALRAQAHKRFPAAISWPPTGLPNDFLALLAPDRSAFAEEGKRVVAHGGMSIEEVIVPYVHIESRRA